MNIKVKMPKVIRQHKGTWGKELLMTFLGTSISIVLTFGTAQMLEHRNKKAIGRQSAMMVIHDIDNSVETLWQMALEEDRLFEMTQYTMANLDNMGPSALDTLMDVLRYLYTNKNFPGLDDVGDSVCQTTHNLRYELDTTGISYPPENREAVERCVKGLEEQLIESLELAKKHMVGAQERYFMYIDPSGEKIEYHWTGYGGDKQVKSRKGYFTKEV